MRREASTLEKTLDTTIAPTTASSAKPTADTSLTAKGKVDESFYCVLENSSGQHLAWQLAHERFSIDIDKALTDNASALGDIVPQLSIRYTISDTPYVSITPTVDDEDAEELRTPIRAINCVRKALLDSLKPIPRKSGQVARPANSHLTLLCSGIDEQAVAYLPPLPMPERASSSCKDKKDRT